MAAVRNDELEFFPFFVDAFLSATMTWPAQRVGAYVRLLSYQWKRGSVPGDDIEEIARVVGESVDVATALWERLRVKFPNGDAGFQNRKLEQVRLDVVRRMKGNKGRTKAATKAAAEARRGRSRTADVDRDDSVTDDVTDPSTVGNLETLKLEIEEQDPPLTPPHRGGERNRSVTDGLTEKPITRAERKEAQEVRDQFGCPHAHPEADPPVPECETAEHCVGRLVGEMRAQVRDGLRVGAA